jgi:hypothetical protein
VQCACGGAQHAPRLACNGAGGPGAAPIRVIPRIWVVSACASA